MPQRRVVIDIMNGTDRDGRGAEAMRAALGLHRSFDAHEVQLVFRDAGVTWAVEGGPMADEPQRQAVVAHLHAIGMRRLVERESLQAHGIDPAALMAGVEVADRSTIDEAVAGAEAHLVY